MCIYMKTYTVHAHTLYYLTTLEILPPRADWLITHWYCLLYQYTRVPHKYNKNTHTYTHHRDVIHTLIHTYVTSI